MDKCTCGYPSQVNPPSIQQRCFDYRYTKSVSMD